jgi:hypothetical protein
MGMVSHLGEGGDERAARARGGGGVPNKDVTSVEERGTARP